MGSWGQVDPSADGVLVERIKSWVKTSWNAGSFKVYNLWLSKQNLWTITSSHSWDSSPRLRTPLGLFLAHLSVPAQKRPLSTAAFKGTLVIFNLKQSFDFAPLSLRCVPKCIKCGNYAAVICAALYYTWRCISGSFRRITYFTWNGAAAF